MKSKARLVQYLDQIEAYIPNRLAKNEKISKVDIAWQLDHCLNVIIGISKALKKSDPKDYVFKFNSYWFVLGTLYWIPRGKGRSPKVVLPEGQLTEEKLRDKVKEARLVIQELDQLHPNAFFYHPYFGSRNLKSALRFMGIHTHHHMKICRDILKS